MVQTFLPQTLINGDTPLHLVAQAGHTAVVQSLLDRSRGHSGRLLQVQGQFGYTALHVAAKHGHTVTAEALLEHGGTQAGALQQIRGNDYATPLEVAREASMRSLLTEFPARPASFLRPASGPGAYVRPDHGPRADAFAGGMAHPQRLGRGQPAYSAAASGRGRGRGTW